MQRVPIISPDGKPLMPTSASRARRWIKEGKAIIYQNPLKIFAVQLVSAPSGEELQPVTVGLDPGKLFSGIAVQSAQSTLWMSGDTKTQISVSDSNWKRIGQFTAGKVRLLKRATGLLVNY